MCIRDSSGVGRYREANELFQRTLRIREQGLGTEHPDVAYTLNELASLYRAQGRYAEAEPLHQRALAIYQKVLGAEHPDTLTTREKYASLLQAMHQMHADSDEP